MSFPQLPTADKHPPGPRVFASKLPSLPYRAVRTLGPSDASETKMSELGRSMIKANPSSAHSLGRRRRIEARDDDDEELRTVGKARKGVFLFL